MSDYAYNRKAGFDYEFLDKYEAGLVLSGQEAKSIRQGHVSLQGAYVIIQGNQAFLLNATVSPYQVNNKPKDYEPTRSRKLLLHKDEIKSLIGATKQKGLTLVAIRVYNKSGKIKLEFALGRGKKSFDKRESIGKRESDRRLRREMRGKDEE